MRLTTLMAEKNLSQAEIAATSAISASVISKLLRGISQPTVLTINQLQAAFPELSGAGIYQDFEEARRINTQTA